MKVFRKENLGSLLILLFLFLFVFLPEPLCASNPFEKIVGKFDSVGTTVLSVAKILCLIGIVVGGVKKVLGHADSWSWLSKAALGTFIVYSSDIIVKWLGE